MNRRVPLSSLKDARERAGLRYAVIPLPHDYHVLVTEHWGRIFGPYCANDDTGTLWISSKVFNVSLFAKMVRQGNWCIGGDRIWLAPEVKYNIADRFSIHEWDSHSLPAQIDPGNYTMLV